MNALDYYLNPDIIKAINGHLAHIHNSEDREDCRQDIFAELYDFCPLDTAEAVTIVNRIGMRFRRGVKLREDNETNFDEAMA